MNDQIVIGLGTAGLCGLGLWHGRRLLAVSRFGGWLAGRLGEDRGLQVLRGVLACGVVFGLLLAADVIRPVKW